ncbi:MAG TPA: hypothetical protein DCG57_11130 [Candidatus Riflebacteria bacterium]|jgi:hypothetical protein|nr:hypothetical protein [Candidatus Riflebacteria bacterium]
MYKRFVQNLAEAISSALSMRIYRKAEAKTNQTGFKPCIYACCLLMLFWPATKSLAAKPCSQPAINRPARQAIELARRARREGRLGNDARATHLWNRARSIEPGIPAAPPDWSFERSSQRFAPSLRERPLTRDELLILITLLPYKRAQKQLIGFLSRFPQDIELRELSLAMAELHGDERLYQLHSSALFGQTLDSYNWVYGMRLLMLLGYVFLIRFLLSFSLKRRTPAGTKATNTGYEYSTQDLPGDSYSSQDSREESAGENI